MFPLVSRLNVHIDFDFALLFFCVPDRKIGWVEVNLSGPAVGTARKSTKNKNFSVPYQVGKTSHAFSAQGISPFLLDTWRIHKDSESMKGFRETCTTSSSQQGVATWEDKQQRCLCGLRFYRKYPTEDIPYSMQFKAVSRFCNIELKYVTKVLKIKY